MTSRRFRTASVLLFVLASASALADEAAPGQASAAVQLIRLQKGSLPQVIMAYGSVQAGASARQIVMAPLSAVVSAIFVREGEEIGRNAPLIRLNPSPKTAASYAQAQSAARVAKDLVQRTRKMVRQHLATQQQLVDAERSESDAESNLQALKAQGAGSVTTVRARAPSIVTALSTSPGAIVSEGSVLLKLAQPTGLVLRVGAIPAQAAAIAPGNKVTIKSLGGGVSFTGRVLLRGSVVDKNSGLVPIEIGLPPGKFFPGQMAEADITTGEVRGYVVPHEAVLVDDQGEPYVVQAVNQVAKKVPVKTLASDGKQDVIAGHLIDGAPVVLAGNYQLEDGMKIRIGPPAGKAAQ